jgi:zinc protease
MRFRSLSLLFLAFLPLWLNAQMNPIKFERYKLPNGLTVILHEDHSTPIVVVSVLYHVGTKNEKPGLSGFAHFFEHLLFEGSDNIGRGEFDKYLKAAGGTNNAYTMQDRTYYFETVPSNQLPLALWLESERMLHAKVDAKGVETQRQVVKEERRQRTDNQPYGKIVEEIMSRAFKVHPYKTTPIGSMADLDAAKESDYVNFYHDFYLPDNAVLTLAGDLTPAQIKPIIEKYFASIPKSSKPIFRPTVVEPPLSQEVRDTVYDKVQLPAVIAAYRSPAENSDDYYAMTMLNTILAEGQSSRIYKSIVDEQQLAVAAGSFSFPLEDPGITIVFGISNMGVDPQKLENAINAQIEKVKTELISENEFQKLRNQIESNLVNKNASLDGIAQNLAVFETHYGDANLINTEINKYLKVTREDLQRVAKKYFDKNNRVLLYWLPKAQ